MQSLAAEQCADAASGVLSHVRVELYETIARETGLNWRTVKK
ncbi:hypothetical protein [Streptomyces sp. HUAS ZL42]